MSGRPERQEVLLRDPQAVGKLLQRASEEIDDIEHAVLTSRDGLVVAADERASGTDGEDSIAIRSSAMAAAAIGIGDHFTNLVAQGRLHTAIFEADRGCVGVLPVSSSLLLVVTSTPGVNLGRFNAAARKVLTLLTEPTN